MDIEYTDEQLLMAFKVCHSGGELSCGECPVQGPRHEHCRSVRKWAVELLERLMEENRKLRDASEKTVEELTRKLVDMAREANTALERGLEGVNQAQLAEMTAIQDELEAFGRDSVIRAEPAGRQDGTMRIMEIVVGGLRVFGGDADG